MGVRGSAWGKEEGHGRVEFLLSVGEAVGQEAVVMYRGGSL